MSFDEWNVWYLKKVELKDWEIAPPILEDRYSLLDALVFGGMTNGRFWKLLMFDLVIGILNILAAMLFLVPLLITVPMSMVAVAHVYRKL